MEKIRNAPERIGLIAGQGDFPYLIAQAARSNGVEVIVIAIRGFARADLADHATRLFEVELGQGQRMLDLLKENGVRHLTMAGRIPHTSIFQYRHFDMRAVKLLAKAANRKADTLLAGVVAELEKEGLEVMDSSLFLKSLMPEPGILTTNRPLTQEELEDIEFGFPIARAVAGQDIGQTIVVKGKMVVAVEGAEGTDQCIRRAGDLVGPGCVVVKVSKPRQDLRFDIPVIGPGTIRSMADAGAGVLVMSARESLLFHREQVVSEADKLGIVLIARENPPAVQESKPAGAA